jgi:hypothetical protein
MYWVVGQAAFSVLPLRSRRGPNPVESQEPFVG